MEREIPRYFDSIVIDSPIQKISTSTSNASRLKVRVFTKFGNRNGSYITEEVANKLIASATSGIVPVIGFFDPETQTWASHTGPTLANAYGYVEQFLGWEPFTDTDGVSREYAVFSVILFTDYFENANKILGQNQSMELDPASIQGDWALIGDTEYFVYTTAKMLGFCVIGEHEPCFSVSSFFSKKENESDEQFNQFASLLADLKGQIENIKGGEQPMDNVIEQQTDVVEEVSIEENAPVEVTETETSVETFEETTQENTLQIQLTELQARYDELQANYNAAITRITELEEFQTTANNELETLRAENQELQTSISAYEAQQLALEQERKNALIKKYELLIDAEEIHNIQEKIQEYSYDELESKLAIIFANQKINAVEHTETKQVPVLEPQESQFALLMKKYRKN